MKNLGAICTFIFIVIPFHVDSMIITSVIAGPKKYNTVSFDLFPLPLAFAIPNKAQLAYRGHYTFRRPFFNIQSSMPVALPMDFMPPNYHHAHEEDSYNAEPSEEEEQDSAPDSNHGDQTEESGDQVSHTDVNVIPTEATPSPRPYTGKAQVSSFIDNGQFVNANTKSVQDAAFGDEADHQTDERSGHMNPPFVPASDLNRRTILDKGKTVSLGYEHKGESLRHDPIAVHNRHPDSMPWGFGYEDMQKYYTTFQFTDSFRTPGTFYPKKSLIASFILG